MSGTYQIDGDLFVTNPLIKSYNRQKLGTDGLAKPIFNDFWTLELSFGSLEAGSGSASAFLMEKWLDDTIHTAVLPHPQTGFLTTFSGVTIEDVRFSFTEFDQDRWTDSGRMTLGHISLTNSWEIPGQGSWWF